MWKWDKGVNYFRDKYEDRSGLEAIMKLEYCSCCNSA